MNSHSDSIIIVTVLAFMQIKLPCYCHSYKKLCLIGGLESGQFKQDLKGFVLFCL